MPQVVNWHGTTSTTNQELWALWVSYFEDKSAYSPYNFTSNTETYLSSNTPYRLWHHLHFGSSYRTNYHLVIITNFQIQSLSTAPQRKVKQWWRHSKRCFLTLIQVTEARNSKPANPSCCFKALEIQIVDLWLPPMWFM